MPARSNDQTVELPAPIGGMEHRVGSSQVGADSFLKLENVDFARNVGILATRKGLAPITTTPVPGGDRIRGGTRFYRTTGKDLVVFADDTGAGTGKAYKYVSPSTWTLLTSFATTGREYYTTAYLDRLYMMNGADAPQTFDGVTTRAMGFIAPTLYPNVWRVRSIPDAMEAFGNKQFEGGVTAANIGGLEGAGVDFSGFGTAAGNFDALVIASRKPLRSVTITMDGGNVNAAAAVLAAKFWNAVGGTWDTLAVVSDGTAAAGASLAQTGEVDLGIGSSPPAGWTAITMSDGRPDMYVLALTWNATIDTPTMATLVEARDWRDDHLAGVQGFSSGDKRRYAYSFVYGTEGESSISPVSPVMEATGTDMLVELPTGGAGVTGRNVYRTKDGNNTDLFLLKEIANNTADGYLDHVNDLQLTTVTVPKDNGVPPVAQFIASFKGRVYMARGNTLETQARLSFSAVSELEFAPGGEDTHHAGPEIFPEGFFIDIGDNNTPITGLAVVLGQVTIFKEDGLYILTGTDPSEFRVIEVHGGVGCIAPRSIVTIDGKVYFLSRNRGRPALYEFAGGFVRPHPGLPIEEFWADNVDGSKLEEATAGTNHGMYRITMPSSEGGGISNREYIYDVDLKRWGMNSRIVAGVYIPWTGSGDEGELYYGSKETAFVIKVDTGDTDQIDAGAAVAIGGEIEMGFLALGHPNRLKQVKGIHLVLEVDPAASPVPTYTLERVYDFGANPVVIGTAESDTDVPVAPTLEASGAGGHHSIHHHRIVCAGSASGDLRDQGYYVKLRLTHTGRIKWHRTSITFDLFEER